MIDWLFILCFFLFWPIVHLPIPYLMPHMFDDGIGELSSDIIEIAIHPLWRQTLSAYPICPIPYLMPHMFNDGVGELSSDIIEIAIHSLRCRFFDGFFQVTSLVIEGVIKAQFFFEMRHFGLTAGEANDGTAFDFGHLTHERAHGSGGAAD